MKESKASGRPRPSAGAAIEDPRFSRLHSDPRFQRMPKNKTKVAIDSRFSHMFSDKNFHGPLGVDKRGRVKKKKETQLLERYYKIGNDGKQEEEEEDAEKFNDQETVKDSSEDGGLSDAVVDSDLEETSSSSSSSSSEGESDKEDDEAAGEEEAEKVPTTNEETQRLALMNMDWEHIKAMDLLVLLRSFLPKGGRVDSVTVYPSEFGLKQMEEEEVHGPKSVFENEDEDEDEDKDEIDMEKLRRYEKDKLRYYYAVAECDSKATANSLYQQCDGLEFERTSNTLDLRFIPDDMKFERAPRDVATEVLGGYKAPEFETRALQHSNVKLTWDDDEPTRVKALRRKFDADQLNEMDFRSYLASESEEEEEGGDDHVDAELEVLEGSEMGLDATGDQKSEEGKSTKLRDKYRSLLLEDIGEDSVVGGKSRKKDVDMEVTFHTGLSELSQKLLQKKEAKKAGDETVWEAYLRKRKEKKAQRKKSARNARSSDAELSEEEMGSPHTGGDPFFTHDENGFNDPFFASDSEAPPKDEPSRSKKVSKGGKVERTGDEERAKQREEVKIKRKEEERSKAELELLLMDDDGVQVGARGFNLKSKKDKRKKDRGKKRADKGKDEEQQDDEDKLATADINDPRFASLFSSHHFAIDPTNPQFRKSTAQLKIMAESQKRRREQSEAGLESRLEGQDGLDASHLKNNNSLGAEDVTGTTDQKRKAEISSLVRSLKRKVGGKLGTTSKRLVS
ncbi:unnamed protein product [Sphagnum compactum]